jgi:hypothetical protein
MLKTHWVLLSTKRKSLHTVCRKHCYHRTGREFFFLTSISIAEFWTPLIGWQVDVITLA